VEAFTVAAPDDDLVAVNELEAVSVTDTVSEEVKLGEVSSER